VKVRFFHNGHVLGAAAFLAAPIVVFMPKAMAPLFVITTVLALSLHYIREKGFPDLPRLFTGLFLLAVVLGLISSLWSISPGDTVSLLPPLAGIFLGGLVLVSVALNLNENERSFFNTALTAGFGLGMALLAHEIFNDIALTRILIPLAKGYDIAEYGKWLDELVGRSEIMKNSTYSNFYKTGAVVLMMLAWPTFIVLWRKGLKAATVIAVIALAFILISSRGGASIISLSVGIFIFATALLLQSRAGKTF